MKTDNYKLYQVQKMNNFLNWYRNKVGSKLPLTMDSYFRILNNLI